MLTCHFCDAELTDSLLQSGRCPNCGAQLRWQGDDEDPLATLRVQPDLGAGFTEEGFVRTDTAEQQPSSADHDVLHVREDLPANDVVDDATRSAHDDTVKEGNATDTPGGAASSSRDPDHVSTLSPEVLARVTGVWSQSVGSEPDIGPGHTIKTHGADTLEEHALVIQTRRLGGYDRPLPPRSDYELIEIIGEGGVGVVYQARQNSVDRMVAVKMLKTKDRDEHEAHDKFLSEAVVTGELEHPNIVPIYDLGTNDDGALFYSMKRVVGTPWDQALPGNSLTGNIEILMKVCDAVAFAHSRGVVHRDLKPENVMLGGFGEVLVMDWGIAISTEPRGGQRDIRRSATMGGTPAYMAPEMATGPLDQIGVASDVYLLAGILFEIVTGKTPHDGKTVMDCLYAAAANEIQPTDASGELLEIARSGMATDPADRFQSVEEFQAAIREYQSHSESIALSERGRVDLQEAIRNASYERFARALFACEEAVSLWPGNEPAQEGVVETRRAYAEAALNNDDYELGLSLVSEEDSRYAEVYAALHAGQVEQQQRRVRIRGLKRMALWLALILVVGGSISYVQIRDQARALQTSEANLLREQRQLLETKNSLQTEKENLENTQQQLQKTVVDLQESENALTGTVDNLEREQRRKDYEKYVADIGLAAEQIEENAFQSAQELLQEYEQSALVNFEWGRQQFLCGPVRQRVPAGGRVRRVQFLDDGRCFVATERGTFGLDPAGVAEMHEPPGQTGFAAVAISPDGHVLAVTTGDEVIHLYEIDASGHAERMTSLEGHTGKVTSLRFSPDGTTLLSTSEDRTARLWDVAAGTPPRILPRHAWTVWQGAFAPDTEGRLATAGQDGRVIIWDRTSGDHDASENTEQSPGYIPKVYYGHHQQPVYAVAFSPDGEWIASGGADGRILVWRRDEAQEENSDRLGEFYRGNWPTTAAIELTGHRGAVRCLSFSPNPDDHLLLSGSDDNTLCLWDVKQPAVETNVVEANTVATDADQRLIAPLRGHSRAVTSCAMSPDGRAVLSGSDDGFWKRWDIAGFRVRTLEGHKNAILAARLSRTTSGRPLIVTAGRDRTARVWTGNPADQPVKLQAGHEYLATSVLAIPGLEDYVITSGGDNTTRVWSLTDGQRLVLDGTGRRAVLAVSADGCWMLTGAQATAADSSESATCARLWRITDDGDNFVLSTPEKPQFKAAPDVQVTAVAIGPDNQTFFVGDTRGVGRLWRPGQAEPVQLIAHDRMITAAAFLPAGRLVTASGDPTVCQWDVASGTEIPALRLPHNGGVTGMSVSPDGRTALTVSLEQRESPAPGALEKLTVVRLWDLDAAAVLWRLDVSHADSEQQNDATRVLTGFSADGGRFFVGNLPAEAGRQQHFRLYEYDWDGGPRWQPDESRDISAANAWSATFSDNGRRLVALGGDAIDAIQVWNVDTGRRLTSLRRQSVVSSVDISPDARRVVTASWDLEVRVWDVERRRVVRQLRNSDDGATFAVRFSPDGQTILTAGEYGLELWNAADYRQRHVDLVDAEHVVIAAAFSGDSRRIAAVCDPVCDDGLIRVWSMDTGGLIAAVSPGQDPDKESPTCCALGPFGRRLAVGTSQGNGWVWPGVGDDQPLGPSLKLAGHTSPVTSVAFSPDGRRAVSGSEDGTAKIWDVDTWSTGVAEENAKQLLTLSRNGDAVTAVDVSADGTLVLTASRDGTAVLWESIPIPPRLRTSTSQREASDVAVPVDPDLVINAPTTPLFDGVTLQVDLEIVAPEPPQESETETTAVAFPTAAAAVTTDGNSPPGDVLTMILKQQELPDEASGTSPDGNVFVLARNGSGLRFSADDVSLEDGERIVAVVNGIDTTRLEIQYTQHASLPEVEAVARSIAYRPAAGHSEMLEMTVQYRIIDPNHPLESGTVAVPAEVRIRVKAPNDDAVEPETAPKETNERA